MAASCSQSKTRIVVHGWRDDKRRKGNGTENIALRTGRQAVGGWDDPCKSRRCTGVAKHKFPSSDASYIHLNVSALDTTYLSEPFSRANAFLLFPSADILCVECVLDVIGVPSENTVYPFAGCCDVRCLRAAYNAR